MAGSYHVPREKEAIQDIGEETHSADGASFIERMG